MNYKKMGCLCLCNKGYPVLTTRGINTLYTEKKKQKTFQLKGFSVL
jgi:hypothetical protein